MRITVELPTEQVKALDSLCRREGISRSEAIRQAVSARVARASALGLWRNRGIDALSYERQLRDEWDGPAVTRPA